ncbi:MAG TPA: VOC family protein [Gaiellaceae bacterium]|nr:VOC family protein [Gaiellaceae bacterium]
MGVAELLVTTAVAVVGLYLAHGFRRQQRLRIAEQRVDAYRKLWSHMLVARPSRLDPPEHKPPLKPGEAAALHAEMTAWYFEGGNGMLLPHDTRELYLEAKDRLGRYALSGDGRPGREAEGRRRMRELSLLRSQMKNDLDIYGVFYFDSLDEGDREFLSAAGLDPDRWGRPWHRRLVSRDYWAAKLRTARPEGARIARMELIHTCYRITDPERSLAFYQALGLEKRRELPIRDEAVNYFLGIPGKDGPELELTYNFETPEGGYEIGTGYGHVALTVDDLDETLAALAEKGIEPERPPYQVREGGSLICFVRDPDSYRVELIERG